MDATLLDWNDMVKHKYYYGMTNIWGDDPTVIHMRGCEATEKSHKDIGRLVRQLGYDLGSIYKSDGSTSTSSGKIQSVLKKYFPDNKITMTRLISECFPMVDNNDGVAIINAADYDETTKEYVNGHTWIADATAIIERYIITYYDYNTVTGEYSSRETTVLQDDSYLHFNWG